MSTIPAGYFSPAAERAAREAAELKPLFVPLYMRYWQAFKDGTKTTEYRIYGPRWNERTCLIGRRVTLSAGYGKKHRLNAVITGFQHSGKEAWIHLGRSESAPSLPLTVKEGGS